MEAIVEQFINKSLTKPHKHVSPTQPWKRAPRSGKEQTSWFIAKDSAEVCIDPWHLRDLSIWPMHLGRYYEKSVSLPFPTLVLIYWERGKRQQSLAARDAESLEQGFVSLVSQWHRDTLFLSSIDKMAMHPAYQRIIGMGPRVLPLILRELQARPDHWFWALHAISGEDPVRPEDTFNEAVEAWLEWGREREYIA